MTSLGFIQLSFRAPGTAGIRRLCGSGEARDVPGSPVRPDSPQVLVYQSITVRIGAGGMGRDSDRSEPAPLGSDIPVAWIDGIHDVGRPRSRRRPKACDIGW